MRTGQYKQRITFTSTGELQIAANGDILGASTVEKVLWAMVTPLKGTRALYYGQIVNGHVHEIRIRFQPSWQPSEEMLINWKGQKLTIQSIADVDNRHQEYLIIAVSSKEGKAVGVGGAAPTPMFSSALPGYFPMAFGH